MYISYQWLQEYLSLPDSADELAKKMSLTGIEIEGVHTIGAGVKKIVVGETLEVIDHPDSDHLHICQVSVGEHAENGVLQIVCGAPNVAKGQKVIVALVGARIKDNIKIKKGKIRGQESQGMLCSLEELGFPTQVIPKDYTDGIFILPPDAPIGADIIEYMHLDDAVLELSITPNRADALSVYGTAYEVGAIYHQTPQIPVQPLQVDTKDHVDHYVKVGVANSTDCPAYYMTVIKDVNIAPSPLWLQMRLMSIGVRPVNNVVDVTNYMLMLYGQPLHAFDYASLMSKDVLVRRAKSDEMLVSLDGSLRELTSTDLIITANDKPVALAGIMGGLETEITEQTTTVALEAAVFNPKCVRATSKRLNLRSEASARFEKGLNLALVQHVIEQASSMIAELANGQVVSGIQSVNTLEVKPIQVRVTLAKINHVLGTCLSDNDLQHIFERLGFETVYESGVYSVSIPPRRWDIHIEADIIEEVARIYGYDNLPATLPTTPSISGGLSPMRQFIRLTNRLLETSGYMQTISYSLTSTQKAGLLAMRDNLGVSLALPMSEDRSVLRRSLLTGLLDIAMYNVARSTTNLTCLTAT